MPYDSSRQHLLDWLERARLLLLRQLVRHWSRVTDSSGGLNDLFVSFREVRREHLGRGPASTSDSLPTLSELDEQLEVHQAGMIRRLEASADRGIAFPIEDVRALFALNNDELDILILVTALELDVGLARLARFVWADFTLVQPTVGWVCEVVGGEGAGVLRVQEALEPQSKLRRFLLVEAAQDDRYKPVTPTLFLRLTVPDRLVGCLAGRGGDISRWYGAAYRMHHDPIGLEEAGSDPRRSEELVRAVRLVHRSVGTTDTLPIVTLIASRGTQAGNFVRAALAGEQGLLQVDVGAEMTGATPDVHALQRCFAIGLRESRLTGATPLFELGELPSSESWRDVVGEAIVSVFSDADRVILLSMRSLGNSLQRVLNGTPEISLMLPPPAARGRIWRHSLVGHNTSIDHLGPAVDSIAERYAMSADAIHRAAEDAVMRHKLSATRKSDTLGLNHIRAAAVRQLSHDLGNLAEPFTTALTWDDVVFREDLRQRLGEIIAFGRNQETVHKAWGFGRLVGYGRGLTVLFGGPPGTGKTMAAALVAKDLGREMFRVDLSRIVDKYIGETEKNLAKIFDEAERAQAVVLFDEADSLFGKRTRVRSSNDRYANLEVNFLLQRMEHFEGTTILTTNHVDGIDPAFERRLKFKIFFPIPDEAEREAIWRKVLPAEAPIVGEVDWRKLAKSFKMAPAHIKNAVVRAAFMAAQEKVEIDAKILMEAAVLEYRELGNLVRD